MDKELQEFWEWCIPERREANRLVEGLPNIPLDLNNLFKYAMPKFEPIDIHFKKRTSYPEHINELNCWFYYQGKQYNGWHLYDSATALYQAIQKARKVKP